MQELLGHAIPTSLRVWELPGHAILGFPSHLIVWLPQKPRAFSIAHCRSTPPMQGVGNQVSMPSLMPCPQCSSPPSQAPLLHSHVLCPFLCPFPPPGPSLPCLPPSCTWAPPFHTH